MKRDKKMIMCDILVCTFHVIFLHFKTNVCIVHDFNILRVSYCELYQIGTNLNSWFTKHFIFSCFFTGKSSIILKLIGQNRTRNAMIE